MPTQLAVDGQPCTQTPLFPKYLSPTLSALLTDPNPADSLSAHFAVWPVDQPAQRTVLTSAMGANGTVAKVGLPTALLVDGRTYEWTVQADDGDDVSGWSAPCQYTVDRTPPNVAPTVTSADYPGRRTSSPEMHISHGLPVGWLLTGTAQQRRVSGHGRPSHPRPVDRGRCSWVRG